VPGHTLVAMTEKPKMVPFMRITVIGASDSGKTALINTWVNGNCPLRYTRTEKAMLYYKRMELEDEGEFCSTRQPIFVEVEDSPGSERGPDGDGAAAPPDDDTGPPRIRKGSRVTVRDKAQEVKNCFAAEEWRRKLEYKPLMDTMLGQEFTVKLVARDGSVGLPSPDGSEGGIWNFPPKAVKLKVSPELPVDKFLDCLPALPKEHMTPAERKQYALLLQQPLSAYQRRLAPDKVSALTRNRMGFMICFDLSDEEGSSLREAMTVYSMLQKSLASQNIKRARPTVFLVGTKSDKSAAHVAIANNWDSAKAWSAEEELPVHMTSARTYKGVAKLFVDMIHTLKSREILWSFEGVDDAGGDDGEEDGLCSLQ